jgi:pimeloyl-ACP methyl ester carboxylesterase
MQTRTSLKRLSGACMLAVCGLALASAACAPSLFADAQTAPARPTAMTATTEYVDVGGHRIAYRSFGQGEPMILVNRMRGTMDTWDPRFVDGLANTHRVILVDYPGVGYSAGALPETMSEAAAFVDRFATAISVQKFVMVGWSWGGAVAQTVMLEHPGRVTHAIIIGANPPGPVDRPIQQAFLDRAFKPVNDLADEEVLFFEPASEVSLKAARASHERIYARAGVTEKIPSSPQQIAAYIKVAQGFTADAEDRRGQLARNRIPMLVIAGDNDISTAGQNWFPLVGQMPNAHLVVYPESGHGPQHQYPELAVDQINSFLKFAGD